MNTMHETFTDYKYVNLDLDIMTKRAALRASASVVGLISRPQAGTFLYYDSISVLCFIVFVCKCSAQGCAHKTKKNPDQSLFQVSRFGWKFAFLSCFFNLQTLCFSCFIVVKSAPRCTPRLKAHRGAACMWVSLCTRRSMWASLCTRCIPFQKVRVLCSQAPGSQGKGFSEVRRLIFFLVSKRQCFKLFLLFGVKPDETNPKSIKTLQSFLFFDKKRKFIASNKIRYNREKGKPSG